jgi:colicin import membrane protein
MRLRLFTLALLCGVSLWARADAENERIAAERAAANARLAEQQRECATRFIVASCVEDARTEHRATLARLRQRELQLDEAKRRATAEARRKAIAERAEAQQSRASDAAPEPPRARVRRAPQPAPVPASRAPERLTPLPGGGTGADRATVERRNEQKFEAMQREAQAHRQAVERRNAQRAAKGKTAAPLSVPGASAPR